MVVSRTGSSGKDILEGNSSRARVCMYGRDREGERVWNKAEQQ